MRGGRLLGIAQNIVARGIGQRGGQRIAAGVAGGIARIPAGNGENVVGRLPGVALHRHRRRLAVGPAVGPAPYNAVDDNRVHRHLHRQGRRRKVVAAQVHLSRGAVRGIRGVDLAAQGADARKRRLQGGNLVLQPLDRAQRGQARAAGRAQQVIRAVRAVCNLQLQAAAPAQLARQHPGRKAQVARPGVFVRIGTADRKAYLQRGVPGVCRGELCRGGDRHVIARRNFIQRAGPERDPHVGGPVICLGVHAVLQRDTRKFQIVQTDRNLR